MRYDISFINLIIPDKVLKDVQLVQLWCNYVHYKAQNVAQTIQKLINTTDSAINHTKSYIK